MARYEFKLPDIGEGIAEAEIVAWHVKIGDQVAEDQQLADMMTDKATVEMESPVAGTVVSLAGEVGDQVPIGSALVVIEVEGDAPAAGESKDIGEGALVLAVGDGLDGAVRAGGLDHRQHGADRYLVAHFAGELEHLARDRAFHLDRRLVGHHVGELLIFLDHVAHLDVPGDDLGLGNAFADVGQLEFVARHRCQSSNTFLIAVPIRTGPGK